MVPTGFYETSFLTNYTRMKTTRRDIKKRASDKRAPFSDGVEQMPDPDSRRHRSRPMRNKLGKASKPTESHVVIEKKEKANSLVQGEKKISGVDTSSKVKPQRVNPIPEPKWRAKQAVSSDAAIYLDTRKYTTRMLRDNLYQDYRTIYPQAVDQFKYFANVTDGFVNLPLNSLHENFREGKPSYIYVNEDCWVHGAKKDGKWVNKDFRYLPMVGSQQSRILEFLALDTPLSDPEKFYIKQTPGAKFVNSDVTNQNLFDKTFQQTGNKLNVRIIHDSKTLADFVMNCYECASDAAGNHVWGTWDNLRFPQSKVFVGVYRSGRVYPCKKCMAGKCPVRAYEFRFQNWRAANELITDDIISKSARIKSLINNLNIFYNTDVDGNEDLDAGRRRMLSSIDARYNEADGKVRGGAPKPKPASKSSKVNKTKKTKQTPKVPPPKVLNLTPVRIEVKTSRGDCQAMSLLDPGGQNGDCGIRCLAFLDATHHNVIVDGKMTSIAREQYASYAMPLVATQADAENYINGTKEMPNLSMEGLELALVQLLKWGQIKFNIYSEHTSYGNTKTPSKKCIMLYEGHWYIAVDQPAYFAKPQSVMIPSYIRDMRADTPHNLAMIYHKSNEIGRYITAFDLKTARPDVVMRLGDLYSVPKVGYVPKRTAGKDYVDLNKCEKPFEDNDQNNIMNYPYMTRFGEYANVEDYSARQNRIKQEARRIEEEEKKKKREAITQQSSQGKDQNTQISPEPDSNPEVNVSETPEHAEIKNEESPISSEAENIEPSQGKDNKTGDSPVPEQSVGIETKKENLREGVPKSEGSEISEPTQKQAIDKVFKDFQKLENPTPKDNKKAHKVLLDILLDRKTDPASPQDTQEQEPKIDPPTKSKNVRVRDKKAEEEIKIESNVAEMNVNDLIKLYPGRTVEVAKTEWLKKNAGWNLTLIGEIADKEQYNKDIKFMVEIDDIFGVDSAPFLEGYKNQGKKEKKNEVANIEKLFEQKDADNCAVPVVSHPLSEDSEAVSHPLAEDPEVEQMVESENQIKVDLTDKPDDEKFFKKPIDATCTDILKTKFEDLKCRAITHYDKLVEEREEAAIKRKHLYELEWGSKKTDLDSNWTYFGLHRPIPSDYTKVDPPTTIKILTTLGIVKPESLQAYIPPIWAATADVWMSGKVKFGRTQRTCSTLGNLFTSTLVEWKDSMSSHRKELLRRLTQNGYITKYPLNPSTLPNYRSKMMEVGRIEVEIEDYSDINRNFLKLADYVNDKFTQVTEYAEMYVEHTESSYVQMLNQLWFFVQSICIEHKIDSEAYLRSLFAYGIRNLNPFFFYRPVRYTYPKEVLTARITAMGNLTKMTTHEFESIFQSSVKSILSDCPNSSADITVIDDFFMAARVHFELHRDYQVLNMNPARGDVYNMRAKN